MPVVTCSSCGGTTNTAVSNYVTKGKDPMVCYAKWVDGVWVKGCGYDDADPYNKSFVDKLINKEE